MHEEFEILIEKRLWGELPMDEAVRLDAHLVACRQCLAVSNEARSQEQMLQDATNDVVAGFDWRAARRELDQQLTLKRAIEVFLGLTIVSVVGSAFYLWQVTGGSTAGGVMPLTALVSLVPLWVINHRQRRRLTRALTSPPDLRELEYIDVEDTFDRTPLSHRALGFFALMALGAAAFGVKGVVGAAMGVMAALFLVFLFLARRR